MKAILAAIGKALWWSAKETAGGFAAAFIIMLGVTLTIGPMFGIALMVDNYGHWWFLAYIPYFVLLPLVLKPFSKIFEI